MRIPKPFLLSLLFAALSVPAWSLTAGPPTQRSAVPAEANGLTCTACHAGGAANSDTRGRLSIEVRDYRPGVKQIIKVILEHPEAVKWGFQLTPRFASNPLMPAGALTPTDFIRVRCGVAGGPVPCADGEAQFASHNGATTTFIGQRNRVEFEVEWTPPAAGGEVIFYAAGNAANNSSTNAGDAIYNANRTIGVETCNLPKPSISAIRSSGSFLDGALSLNTLISIGGAGFQAAGSTRTAGASDLIDGKYPTELSCIAVEVAGRRTPLLYAQANQINAQIPTIADRGSVSVAVVANPGTPNERKSDPSSVTLAAASPAFFRLLPTPCIAAIFATTGQLTADPSLFPSAKGVRPGDFISLYATGLGVLDPVYQAGEIVNAAVRLKETVQIEWAGRTLDAADVLYAGSAPGFLSGVYQINIRVPGNVTSNAQNQVRMRVGGGLSPEGTTIYVAPQ